MFESVSNRVDFPGQEEKIRRFWSESDIFNKSLIQRKGAPVFTFYDGPPFATGLPHYGHLLAGTIKDIIPRYKTMRGNYVSRRFGWDCHGLPVEYEMEQTLDINGKREIEELGIDVFNEKCRGIVLRYTSEWREIVSRTGRWVNFENEYKTMDLDYMESIWWVFKSLWEKKLIYKGQRIVPYCPRCATPLSNFETNQGYADTQDPAITVKFALANEAQTYLLAWTTTPWTLPSNMGLAVGREIEYVKVRDGAENYWMAKDRLSTYYADSSEYEILETAPGSKLEGSEYVPLFPYFKDLRSEGAFRVLNADFVSTEDGTGIVHIAPGFGEDDYELGKSAGLPTVCPIDDEAKFTDEVSNYAGRPVKETDSDIMRQLKREGKLVHQSTINHSYPHCWRCDTPLIYRGIGAWYVNVTRIKDRMLKANQDIHWIPEHLQKGRFGKWLEGARDWNISRNRYWGTPLPIWSNRDGTETVCIGSAEELEKLSGRKVTDLHKHCIDDIEIPSQDGKESLKRIPEVLDCWFESGSMPYAQNHYPFEKKEEFEANFPADFIAEGLDQTRGWFYTLTVIATALFDKPAFRNVVVNGMVLAEDGRKMSKRLKNYPDPMDVVHKYGADALRLFLINSPVVKGESLRFSESGVKDVLRHLLLPWWNAYSFLVTYANIDGWDPSQSQGNPPTPENPLDAWIQSSLASLSQDVTKAMDKYDLQQAVGPFVKFIGDLTNWYIRRSRRRFWKSSNDEDKNRAYWTLYNVLLDLCRIAAPFVPFISEAIYLNLRTNEMPESVHLCDFPTGAEGDRDRELEEQMAAIMSVVGMGRLLRSENKLKVRQPLKCLHVVCRDSKLQDQISELEEVIKEELNVSEVCYGENASQLARVRLKPNFKILGPRLGGRVKAVASRLSGLDQELAERVVQGEPLSLDIGNETVQVNPDELEIAREPREGLSVQSEGELVIALDLELTDNLVREGLAREFVNKVQNMRKEADLDVVQRINLSYKTDAEVKRAIEEHLTYVKSETLALECSSNSKIKAGVDWDLNNHPCRIVMEVPSKR